MELRKGCAVAAGTLFLASAGLTFVAAPAVAAPVPGTTVAAPAAPGPDRDFRQGYRAGYDDGWEQAREECRRDRIRLDGFRRYHEDWIRGYHRGWDRGYEEGYHRFCWHKRGPGRDRDGGGVGN